MADNRTNLWAFVVYPGDSLPDNYEQIINSWHVPTLCSPIHDADINADDTEKKTHMHIMMYFGVGRKISMEQVISEYSSKLNGTIPIQVKSRDGMVRYFVHKDNPEKHQYDINDIKSFAGFEYLNSFENYTSEAELYKFIENLIRKHKFINFVTLNMYLTDHNMTFENMFVRKHHSYFNIYLNGMYQRNKK